MTIQKILSKCDEVITDYCIENDIQRKVLAQGMGISYKQLMNVLAGEVDSSFDIITTILVQFGIEEEYAIIFDTLFTIIQKDESFITPRNLFTLYELSSITGNKEQFVTVYLEKLKSKSKMPKTAKQTIQIILEIENSFTYDTDLELNIQPLSLNAKYLSIFSPVESNEKTVWEFETFLDYCINMRRNERVAVYYYNLEKYVEAAEIYQKLYDLPSGEYHRRYLGYKLLQTHSQIRIYEPLVAKIRTVFVFEDERFRQFLDMYIEKKYYKVPHFPLFVKYWFTRDKENLIKEFEYTTREDELYTMKLLLADLTESCSYIL